MKYQLKEERQLNRFPKMPLWYDKDMFIAFLIGVVIGSIINWLI